MASEDENQPAAGNGNITLKSSDGREFAISKSAAALSAAIEEMMKDMPAEETEIPLQDVDGETLHNVVTYLNAHAAAGDNENEKKRFDGEFLPGKPEMGVLFDVVLAANNLKIEGLMDLVSGKIADRIKNKSVEWVRREFDFENDLTAEEVSEMMDQTPWAFEGVDPDEEQLVD